MPQIDITDLLAEANIWTGFAHCFSHLRTGDDVRHTPALLAAILGDGTNLGAKRMADASAELERARDHLGRGCSTSGSFAQKLVKRHGLTRSFRAGFEVRGCDPVRNIGRRPFCRC